MEIGVGLIGAGFMAKAHTNALNTIPYIFYPTHYTIHRRIIGASTREKAEAAAKRYGYERACSGYEEAIASPDVDLIDVSTSDALHKEIAMAAIRAGKHVLCEKPMALTREDALEMYLLAKDAPVKAMVGFNYRFLPAVRLAKNLIDGGVLGKIYHFHGVYNQDSGAFEDTPFEKVWYAGGSKGSGVSLGIGSHIIDMGRFLCGEVTEVTGLTANYNPVRPSQTGPRKVEREEEMLALFSFASGATGSVKASAVAAGRKNQLAFEVNGSKGSLTFTLEAPNFLQVFLKERVVDSVVGFTNVDVTQIDRGHPFMQYWWPRGHGIGWEHTHINEIAHLLSCIAEDQPIAPYGATFEDGYKSLAIIDAIKQSSQTGERVQMNEIWRIDGLTDCRKEK